MQSLLKKKMVLIKHNILSIWFVRYIKSFYTLDNLTTF